MRKLRRYWLLSLLLLVIACLAVVTAFAQTSPTDSTAALPDLSGVVTVNGDGKVTVNVGLFGSQIIAWLVTTFGGVISLAVSAWIVTLIQKMRIQATETLRARFQQIILSGLSIGAAKAQETLRADAPKIEIKNEAAATAVQYVQAHGAETAKKLGLDVQSADAVEAIKANIEKMVNDPAIATPASISPPKTATAPDVVKTEKTTIDEAGDKTTVTTTEAKPPI